MPGFEIFGEEERKEVNEVLETGVLFRYGFEPARKGRFKAMTFEKELAARLGSGYAHLCSSGTAALSIALNSCGIGAGDEVVVPPFTFIATIEAVLNAGAIPVFSEIDNTLCLDPKVIKDAISGIPGISFRDLPDEQGDSATFLCFLLPDEGKARHTVKELGKAGVDGCFYWYDNKWHYIRQWDHLKKMASSARLPLEMYEDCPDYESIEFPVSNNIMGRLISMQIKLSWTEAELDERITKITGVLKQSS